MLRRENQPDIDWSAVDIDDLVRRLLLFTKGRIRGLTWRNSSAGQMPGGLEPEDFVYEAIAKTVSGQRAWNCNVSLFQHLAGIIRSEVGHLAVSKENRTSVHLDDGSKIEDVPPPLHPSPEEIHLGESEEEDLLNYLGRKEPLLRLFTEALLNGYRGTVEISNLLGISIAEVNNLKKRVKRTVSSYRQERQADIMASVEEDGRDPRKPS